MGNEYAKKRKSNSFKNKNRLVEESELTEENIKLIIANTSLNKAQIIEIYNEFLVI